MFNPTMTEDKRQSTRLASSIPIHVQKELLGENIPAQIRRYRIKGGGEVYDYLKDKALVSNRNPRGSRYAEEVIEWVDTIWPGETADVPMDPAHRLLVIAPFGKHSESDKWSKKTEICFKICRSLDLMGLDVKILFSKDKEEIFKTVQEIRPTILCFGDKDVLPEICSRVEQFHSDGMMTVYLSCEVLNEDETVEDVDLYLHLDNSSPTTIYGRLIEMWNMIAKDRT